MSGVRLRVRNFYGELTVKDSDPPASIMAVRTLTHGTITHGDQFLNLAKRDLPTTYYGPATGVGLAIRDRGKGRAVRVGVIGLGTGTLAAYGRLGDYYRYYEINPLVVRVARGEFTFLADCHGKLDIAMGDARLTLEREQPENFDVLAVDAFSGDAIPVHLLTREAMDLYFRHLRPDGILAVHISNRHLDLLPVLAGEARSSGRRARVVDTEDDDEAGVFAATWVLVVAPPGDFDNEVRANSNPVSRARRVRLWTDDYSNLFQILK
jgi:SAM-dependent methyltransferase